MRAATLRLALLIELRVEGTATASKPTKKSGWTKRDTQRQTEIRTEQRDDDEALLPSER